LSTEGTGRASGTEIGSVVHADRKFGGRAEAPAPQSTGDKIADATVCRANFPNPTSPYYQMELNEILQRGYPGYQQIPAIGTTLMSLTVRKTTNDLDEAVATPPHVKVEWSTSTPIPARQLIEELRARGCHQRDIGDAMYEQDPRWIEKL
jgi:hypothetical protein